MEDRYLFKAKRLDNGEWVKGALVYDDMDKLYRIITELNYSTGTCITTDKAPRVDASTICQCTGLKDKNGKLIWENDIIAYWDTYSTESGLAEADCAGQVVWDDETMSFQVTNRLSAESYEVLDECSVIGNVFDETERIKQFDERARGVEIAIEIVKGGGANVDITNKEEMV